ncbi:hypothetical protein SELMODRAFT_138189, partial [Selaginella moellendorffii]
RYSNTRAYSQSKIVNILHAKELAMRFKVFDAATTCYTALHPSLKDVTGQYFVDSNKSSCSAYGRDPELAHKLWTFSQELIDKRSPS